MRRLNPRLAASQEEFLQPGMPERLNHVSIVARSASRVKHQTVANEIWKPTLDQNT
jgi:hypothetical protein